MSTVVSVIRHLFPNGTRGGSDSKTNGENASWQLYPHWPPDAFAAAATLVNMSGCYACLGRAGGGPFACFVSAEMREDLMDIADGWRNPQHSSAKRHPKLVQERIQCIWDKLSTCELDVSDYWHEDSWSVAALKLMIIADEACNGIGFHAMDNGKETWITAGFRMRNLGTLGHFLNNDSLDASDEIRQRAIVTACVNVPPEILCVQPKTRTPQVGCSLRSLSHHLALLPPKGQVMVRWNQFEAPQETVFNLLVVPFPYDISGRCFRKHPDTPDSDADDGRVGYFGVEQRWLPDDEPAGAVGDYFIAFLENLLSRALKEVSYIDGIVLPELALDWDTYSAVARRLRQRRYRKIGFFIAGVMMGANDLRDRGPAASQEGDTGEVAGRLLTNTAFTTVFLDTGNRNPGDADGEAEHKCDFIHAPQRKHHRWKLDRGQITQYSIGDALDPSQVWWEDIVVEDRNVNFFAFRHGACFATLVCEDLARIDPCQTVLRSVGPNLVIALLMDGPQLKERWPGRYAMGLAEDPGCSVLSVTSLGLVKRSNNRYGTQRQVIGLWREPEGDTRELELPGGFHALLLSLTGTRQEEMTLDGRSNEEMAYALKLSGVSPVRASGTEHFDAG